MVFAIFAGGWREECPRLILRHGGVCDAHVLRGVGFPFPKPAVAFSLGGEALFWAERLAKLA